MSLFHQKIATNTVIKIRSTLTKAVLLINGDHIKDIKDKLNVQPTINCLSATKNTAINPHEAINPNKQHKIQSKMRTGLFLFLSITKIICLMTDILILKATWLCVVTNKIFI